MSGLRVAAVQHDIVWEDAPATLDRLASKVALGAAAGARLVTFTEMFASGFSMSTHRTAEPLDGPTATWMAECAAEHDVWVAGSVPVREPHHEHPSNTLLVVGPDGTRHRYDKIHPFSYAGEHERFRSGASSVVVTVDGVRLGLSVCYDLRFSDLYWNRATQVDAELIVANWPASRREHWQVLTRARAVENQVYVVAVNRVGSGGKLDYAGDSRIVAPDGELLASAARAETVLLADLDPQVVAATRERLPFLPDRR